jgi:hypothetical protein
MSDSAPVAEESGFSRIIEELIAKDLGIDPSEVTQEFIHRWRQEFLYPNAQHGLNTKYGSYNGSRNRILSGSEVQTLRESAERFLRSFSKESEESDVDERPARA